MVTPHVQYRTFNITTNIINFGKALAWRAWSLSSFLIYCAQITLLAKQLKGMRLFNSRGDVDVN